MNEIEYKKERNEKIKKYVNNRYPKLNVNPVIIYFGSNFVKEFGISYIYLPMDFYLIIPMIGDSINIGFDLFPLELEMHNIEYNDTIVRNRRIEKNCIKLFLYEVC